MDTENWEDYTDRICDPRYREGDEESWPMYSFKRVAFIFWNAFANALKDRGLSDKEIKDQLQSKGMRWMLDDGPAMQGLEILGYELGQTYKPIKLD